MSSKSMFNPFGSHGGLFGPLSSAMVPKQPKVEEVPEPPAPQPEPTPPARTDPETDQAAQEAARRAVLEEEERRRRRSNTVLTSPMGTTEPAPVTRKTLLGG